ncbi:MAG TPA: FAD-dependent monooxygenase, partial [Prolixibacteraceae bacterium]|nr:FAD-dependent monooxygenase [Prolixibacteraceae bacterium]
GQGQTEGLLNQFLSDHGRWVERGASLKVFKQEKGIVQSKISKPDGSVEVIRSRYLIGADGKDSVVRKQLEIPFPGKTQSSRLFITDCEARLPLSSREIFFSFASDITSGFFPLKGNRWRVDGLIPDIQQEDVSFETVKNYFGRKIRSGIELFHPQWFSVFRSHSRCADQFRNKRCFLIGDAAHVHSPVGAQGMNTGMQDAFNLAWKMGFVIRGKANEKLLDTYEAERRPLALKIIRNTDIAYSLMTTQSLPARLLRLHLLPLALPLLLSWITRNRAVRNRIFNAVSGIGISYEKSILSASFPKGDFHDHSPKPGDRLPSLPYMKRGKRTSLYHGLSPTGFYLFVFGKHLLPAPFQQVLTKYKGIVSLKYIDNDTATQIIFDTFGIKEEGCYLVRPDLYIAWRCHGFDEEGLNEYLKRALK